MKCQVDANVIALNHIEFREPQFIIRPWKMHITYRQGHLARLILQRIRINPRAIASLTWDRRYVLIGHPLAHFMTIFAQKRHCKCQNLLFPWHQVTEDTFEFGDRSDAHSASRLSNCPSAADDCPSLIYRSFCFCELFWLVASLVPDAVPFLNHIKPSGLESKNFCF